MTLSEAYSQLPKTIGAKAKSNLQKYPITFKEHKYTLDSTCRSLAEALLNFKWASTKEGVDYWLDKYQKYEHF